MSIQDFSEFLSDARLAKIGSVNGALLCQGSYWIHRRKESIAIVDETAVRRTTSVDFTLPEKIDREDFDAVIQQPQGAGDGEDGYAQPVYCPPLFVLPKAAGELMSFDLKNEAGVSLPLMTRRDNARVSAATLESLACRVLGCAELSPSLSRRLSDLATANTVRPVAAERLLRADEHDDDFEQLKALRDDRNFVWWLWTLAHSSLVSVPFRDPYVRRKIFALSYVEPFVETPPRAITRFGWTPYKVVIDLSWIGARNFHFEAESPPGLRIAKATLAEDDDDETPLTYGWTRIAPAEDEHGKSGGRDEGDTQQGANDDGRDKDDKPILEVSGFLRRVHLSRYEAAEAGAAVATLDLRVNGHGFVGGAMLACGLVVAAVAGCLLSVEDIAKSPTTAPAALLLLPGLIATYVGRPDQHALTTTLLSFARWLLLAAGVVAYGCAAFVALGGAASSEPALGQRVAELELAFYIGGGFAIVCFAGLVVGWLLAKPSIRGLLRCLLRFEWVPWAWKAMRRTRFAHSVALPLSHHALMEVLESNHGALLNLRDDSLEPFPPDRDHERAFVRYDMASTWRVGLCVLESGGETELRIHGECLPRLLAKPMLPLLLRREARAARKRLHKLSEAMRK